MKKLVHIGLVPAPWKETPPDDSHTAVRLEHWRLSFEHGSHDYNTWISLWGMVDGHHKRTSPIAGGSGRVIFTQSGSRYELGQPNPDWLAYLARLGDQTALENDPVQLIRKLYKNQLWWRLGRRLQFTWLIKRFADIVREDFYYSAPL